MMKSAKTFALIISLFIIICITILGIGVISQYMIYKSYGEAFNSERKKLGLQAISPNLTKEKITWLDFNKTQPEIADIPDFFIIEKYGRLFKGGEIITYSQYQPPITEINNSIFKDKTIWFSTSIFPWYNKIKEEADTYKLIINDREEWLEKWFVYSDEYGNQNYFRYYYYNFNKDESLKFSCGTSMLETIEEMGKAGTPYKGNISKLKADSILIAWQKFDLKR